MHDAIVLENSKTGSVKEPVFYLANLCGILKAMFSIEELQCS